MQLIFYEFPLADIVSYTFLNLSTLPEFFLPHAMVPHSKLCRINYSPLKGGNRPTVVPQLREFSHTNFMLSS